MSEGSSKKRKVSTTTYITCPIVFGSTAVHLGKKSGDTATHRWKLYIRGPKNEDLSCFVEKVAFTLHPSFPEPVREISSPPFEVSETGWGEFEASIRIYFRDPSETPIDLFHLIKLYPVGPPQPAGALKKPSAVVAEQYDEIVFCDPSDKFSKQLMQYCVRKGSKASSSDPAQEGVLSNAVFDDAQDLERLGGIHQHILSEIEVAKARLLQLHAEVVDVIQQQRQNSGGGGGAVPGGEEDIVGKGRSSSVCAAGAVGVGNFNSSTPAPPPATATVKNASKIPTGAGGVGVVDASVSNKKSRSTAAPARKVAAPTAIASSTGLMNSDQNYQQNLSRSEGNEIAIAQQRELSSGVCEQKQNQ